jgi:hypothetical protein
MRKKDEEARKRLTDERKEDDEACSQKNSGKVDEMEERRRDSEWESEGEDSDAAKSDAHHEPERVGRRGRPGRGATMGELEELSRQGDDTRLLLIDRNPNSDEEAVAASRRPLAVHLNKPTFDSDPVSLQMSCIKIHRHL